jgi:hypothetical protein
MKTLTTVNLDNTLANWQAFYQAVYDGFTGAGWTQTSDTGQVDPSTLAAIPTAADGSAYMLFQQADTLASTFKIIVKVAFNRNSGDFGCYCTIGTGTDGAGTFVGSTRGGKIIEGVAAAGTGNAFAFSGDAGTFAMHIGTTNRVTIALDRSRDTDGAATDEYVTFLADVFSVSNMSFVNVFQTGIVGGGGLLPLAAYDGTHQVISHALPAVTGSVMSGGTTPVSPIFPQIGRLGNPLTRAVVVRASDIAAETEFDLNLYGATRHFLALYPCGGLCGQYDGTYNAYAFLWEA